jgi:chromosome segregation ATPase
MNSELQQPTERLISEIGDLNGLISTKGEQIRLLHVKVNELTSVNKSLNSENERLTQEKRDLRNELKSRDSPVRGLTIKTAEMGYVNPSTILKLENHIALLTTELTRMNNDFNDKSGECFDANSQLNEQKLSMSKLDSENERLSNDISSMASDLAFKLETIGRFEAENLKLRNEVSAMRHQAHVSNSSLIKVKDQYQSEYLTTDKLKERYDQEHKFMLDLQYQLQQEKNCVHELKTKFYQIETNNEGLKIENSDLHKQVRALRDSVDFYENENVRQSKEFEIRYETL